nr:TBC1 domain family member 1-like [Procambarus clarkii]
MMEGMDNTGLLGDRGEAFFLVYRGSTEVDRHYSKPMLPWIISEIKNRQKSIKVTVEINRGNVTIREVSTGIVILSHMVKQIHKCVMEQADHTCFLYTLKPVDKEHGSVFGAAGYVAAADPSQLIPANVPADQNYQCHLLQAANEQQVRSFFTCLRQQPKEVQQCSENSSLSSLNSLPDLYVHNESQFFEVLFVGRVKVSHAKVPQSFIDEALSAFKLREKSRQRHASGEASLPQPNSAAVTYQQEGSGVSVPNIVFTSLSIDSDSEFRSRSNSRDLGKIELPDKGKQEQDNQEGQKNSKVKFSLWSSTEQAPESPAESPNVINVPQSADLFLPASAQTCLPPPVDMVPVTIHRSSSISGGECEKSTSDSSGEKAGKAENEAGRKAELSNVEPFRQRLRTVSGDSSHIFHKSSHNQDQGMRTRTGSIGSMTQRNRGLRPFDNDLKMLSQDFNRTMLFHIGRSEIQLINPEMKSVQLNKNFKDIAHCCQGVKNNDHFGFICRELSGEAPCYLGYVFKCQMSSVTDEIMQALSKAFAAIHEAQIRERQENLLCDLCPMKWFSQLCTEVEGLPAAKAHVTIKKRLSSLPEEEKSILIAKYEGAETPDTQLQNNILMMLLRAHFENKQAMHSHTALPGGGVRLVFPDIALLCSLEIIDDILKKCEEKVVKLEEENGALRSEFHTYKEVFYSKTLKSLCCRVNIILISSLPTQVKMSSFSDVLHTLFFSFLKVGYPSPRGPSEEESAGTGKPDNTSTTSFRHAILQRVVSPSKNSESLGQLGSRSHHGNNDNIIVEKRSKEQLKIIWKKAVFQQILLLRFERENQRLRALQQEVALQRVRLNYEEEEIPEEATQAWQMLVSRPMARIDSSILHSGIKQGIPKAVRGEAWQLLMYQYLAHNPKLEPQFPSYNLPYESMIKELTSQHHAILIDLGRTFPTHPYYMQTLGPGQLALFNLLKAYSLLDKDVGYCQGLSFVGGILLLHVEEEAAYNLLKHLMYVMGCRRQYRPDLIGLQVQMYQLSRLLHDQLRKLYDHFETHEVTPQLFAAPWFLTLFASQFPLTFVCRVFDMLLMEGMEAVFRVALVLLRVHEEALLACESFEQLMDFMKTSMSNLNVQQTGNIIAQACECTLKQELQAYEVEYHVLQEELALSPQNHTDFQKMKEANKNLKRQNLDLLEQLHHSNSHQHALETSNQSLQQSQHHLEVRVRWLELERGNLKHLVDLLAQKVPPESLSGIPPNLQRFLPINSKKAADDSEKDDTKETDDISSSLPSPSPSNHQHQQHAHTSPRAVSMDYSIMQRYIKNLVGND